MTAHEKRRGVILSTIMGCHRNGGEGVRMKLIEKRYRAERGDSPDAYQTLEVIQEAPEPQEASGGRCYIRFSLMEQRWRSKREAASYLRWAAKEIEKLQG